MCIQARNAIAGLDTGALLVVPMYPPGLKPFKRGDSTDELKLVPFNAG